MSSGMKERKQQRWNGGGGGHGVNLKGVITLLNFISFKLIDYVCISYEYLWLWWTMKNDDGDERWPWRIVCDLSMLLSNGWRSSSRSRPNWNWKRKLTQNVWWWLNRNERVDFPFWPFHEPIDAFPACKRLENVWAINPEKERLKFLLLIRGMEQFRPGTIFIIPFHWITHIRTQRYQSFKIRASNPQEIIWNSILNPILWTSCKQHIHNSHLLILLLWQLFANLKFLCPFFVTQCLACAVQTLPGGRGCTQILIMYMKRT